MKYAFCLVVAWAVIAGQLPQGGRADHTERFDAIAFFVTHYAKENP